MNPFPTPARSTPRVRRPFGLLAPFLALLLCGAGDTRPAAPSLTDGLSLERDLRGGETHVYPVELQAGQFLRVIVQEEGIDLVVRLLDPEGAEVTGVDGIVAGHSDEDLAAIAPSSGPYRLEIQAPNPRVSPGKYRLQAEGPRAPRGEDATRAEAVKDVRAAIRENGQDAEAALRRVRSLERALALWRELRESRRSAETSFLLGRSRTLPEDSEQAAKDYSESARLWGTQPDLEARNLQTRSLNVAGMLLKGLGRVDDARRRYEEALAVARASADRRAQAVSLSNLALLDVEQGELREGIEVLLQALQKSREAGDRDTQARTLIDLGYAYDQLAERQTALQYYLEVLGLARSSANRELEANALNNLGESYLALGDWETALKHCRQSLALIYAIPVSDRPDEGKVIINLGDTLQRMGRLEEARKTFLQALQVSRDPETRMFALIRQAYLLAALKQPAKAVESARQAVQLAHGVQNREVTALYALGVAHREAGDLDAAREELTRALSLARNLKDRSREAEIGLSLARAERKAGDLAAALGHMRSAVEILESLRTKVFDQRLRASFLATNQDFYEDYADLLMSSPEPQRGEALQIVERARARSLLDTLAESGADVRKGTDPALVERERRLRDQLNTRDAYHAQLLSEERPDPRKLEEAERRLEETLDAYRQLQAEQRANHPEYAALTQPRPLTVGEIQGQVLDGEAVLLEYSLGRRRSFLWAVTPGAVVSYELPGRDQIESLARRYYGLVTARNGQRPGESLEARKRRIDTADADAERAGRELSRRILGPAERLLGDRPLLIVADGALQYIPFAALPIPSSGAPLATRHVVVSLPSASVLAVLRREIQGRRRAPKTLAIFADPVFQPTDKRLAPSRRFGRTKLAARRGGEWSPADERQSGGPERLSFGRLFSSDKEARAISALVPPDQLFLARGFQASRSAVLRPELAQYRNLHFATHGVLDSRRPELSKLVLSLYDEQGRPQDGFLRLNDVYNLRLDADLVVLSACQTALGKEVRGEGLIGLTRGFMYAGAARVLASLWSVEDRPTADLMAAFYRGMLRDKLSPAAALRKAQLEMAKDPDRKAPYYWAGFSLQGEWR
jgi:CHAT domain-containing protein/Flp pilus assembly protein TadD